MMRQVKLLIFCFIAFSALSMPVLAANVDVTFDVQTVWSIENYCGNHIYFYIGSTAYNNTRAYPSGDPSHIRVKSNQPYNVYIEYDCSGFPAGWQLWTKQGSEVPTNHSGAYEIKDVATALYWSTNKPPTNQQDWYFYYMVDSLELADGWVGYHYKEMTVVYTLATSI